MPGIYIAAVLTSLLAIAIFSTLIYKLPRPANGWLLLCVCRCSGWLSTWCVSD